VPPRVAPRREPRRRDDDLGPGVTGFGSDLPAFMLLRSRSVTKPAVDEGDGEA
jgi:hypothetical protein